MEWKRPHTPQLHDLHSPPCTIKVLKSIIMTWAGHVARTEKRRGAYTILMGETRGGKRPLGKPRRRWENIIKMGLQGV